MVPHQLCIPAVIGAGGIYTSCFGYTSILLHTDGGRVKEDGRSRVLYIIQMDEEHAMGMIRDIYFSVV